MKALDAIIDYFPLHPEYMAAFYMRNREDYSLGALCDVFQKSEDTIRRLLKTARLLLKSKFPEHGW